jgi:hypothetical protein
MGDQAVYLLGSIHVAIRGWKARIAVTIERWAANRSTCWIMDGCLCNVSHHDQATYHVKPPKILTIPSTTSILFLCAQRRTVSQLYSQWNQENNNAFNSVCIMRRPALVKDGYGCGCGPLEALNVVQLHRVWNHEQAATTMPYSSYLTKQNCL